MLLTRVPRSVLRFGTSSASAPLRRLSVNTSIARVGTRIDVKSANHVSGILARTHRNSWHHHNHFQFAQQSTKPWTTFSHALSTNSGNNDDPSSSYTRRNSPRKRSAHDDHGDDEVHEIYGRDDPRSRSQTPSGSPTEAPEGSSNLTKLLYGVPVVGALLGKSKYLLVGAKFLKFKSLLSLGISVGAYSLFFGLPYAAGIVGMLAVHEAGHALVMAQYGIKFHSTMFIPFMGAYVAGDQGKDAYEVGGWVGGWCW